MRPSTSSESSTPNLLYLFVAGPGYGEGIAVACPGGGWLVVDGCSVEKDSPIAAILRGRPRNAPSAYVLTHPHDDHASGVPRILEALRDLGPADMPKLIGLTGLMEGRALLDAYPPADLTRVPPARHAATRRVQSALNAIDSADAVKADPRCLRGMHAGQQWTQGDVVVTARSPAAARLQALARPEDPNLLSVVLELEYGASRLVLGSDLVVAGGWDEALPLRAELVDHHAWKVSHHGSREALPLDMVSPPSRGRAWVVTPFNRQSPPLPRARDVPTGSPEEGLRVLLCGETGVLLTSIPAAAERQVNWPPPARLTRGELDTAIPAVRRGSPFMADAVQISSGLDLEALDPVIGLAFDDQGALRGRWRGRAAFELVETR